MTPTQSEFESCGVLTPAFVYDEATILAAVSRARRFATQNNCKLLYSLKPFVIAEALQLLVGEVDGFSASSVFEATLARQILRNQGTVHITAPGLCEADMPDVEQLCDYLSFNSAAQWFRLHHLVDGDVACGIRINPQLSFVADPRYDPCRINSKLGVSPQEFIELAAAYPRETSQLTGIHFHSNCDSSDYSQLYDTVKLLRGQLGSQIFASLQWVNIGGGYTLGRKSDLKPLQQAVQALRGSDSFEIFMEPGATLVRDAGYIVSRVVDMFQSGTDVIAVLDTTVNHLPEVFEYQFEPDVLADSEEGEFEYTLAGCTCLAGDLFGRYGFAQPLSIGSVVVFTNVGAYSLVKAHMFNGINLPTVYARNSAGMLRIIRKFVYNDFAQHNALLSS